MNPKMILAITVAVFSVLIASTAQLTELLGPQVAKTVVTVASLLNSLLASISAVLTTQRASILDVQAMPGVEKIVVNEQANATLAHLAVDPNQDKVEAKTGTEARIQATATANT